MEQVSKQAEEDGGDLQSVSRTMNTLLLSTTCWTSSFFQQELSLQAVLQGRSLFEAVINLPTCNSVGSECMRMASLHVANLEGSVGMQIAKF